ncbi:MAG: hypothetical protein KDB23_01950 [Planctomycetales bacterium]|nr:hypothetical protein [Planctomycetales bacterium]
MKRLKDHLNATPDVIRWVITEFLVWPIVFVRIAIIGGVLLLWLYFGPGVLLRSLESVHQALSLPNTNRPPMRSQAMQELLDDLNDVRVRLGGLRSVPERRTFRSYQHAGENENRRACSSAQQTMCE